MIRHVVRPGECLSRIARRYGFASYLTVWNHRSNAELRARRGNPNVLCPGDVVHVPEKAAKIAETATAQRARFVVQQTKKQLRVVFADARGRPLANLDCMAVVAGARRPARTDAAGQLTMSLPVEVEVVLVEIQGRQIELGLGELDPVGEPGAADARGVQQRLHNLGYDVGAIDGRLGPRTRSALRLFQADQELEVDGATSRRTLDRLIEQHGS